MNPGRHRTLAAAAATALSDVGVIHLIDRPGSLLASPTIGLPGSSDDIGNWVSSSVYSACSPS